MKVSRKLCLALASCLVRIKPYKAGCIKVCCPKDLAAVATSSIHRGSSGRSRCDWSLRIRTLGEKEAARTGVCGHGFRAGQERQPGPRTDGYGQKYGILNSVMELPGSSRKNGGPGPKPEASKLNLKEYFYGTSQNEIESIPEEYGGRSQTSG